MEEFGVIVGSVTGVEMLEMEVEVWNILREESSLVLCVKEE